MDETLRRPRRFARFGLRDLFWLLLCAAILAAWYADRRNTAHAGPRAIIDSAVHDWGVTTIGSTPSHAFVIRNAGNQPLWVWPGEVTMKLQVADCNPRVVAPRQSATIEVRWPIESYMQGWGTVRQWLDVLTNDPNQPRIRLTVAGQIP